MWTGSDETCLKIGMSPLIKLCFITIVQYDFLYKKKTQKALHCGKYSTSSLCVTIGYQDIQYQQKQLFFYEFVKRLLYNTVW